MKISNKFEAGETIVFSFDSRVALLPMYRVCGVCFVVVVVVGVVVSRVEYRFNDVDVVIVVFCFCRCLFFLFFIVLVVVGVSCWLLLRKRFGWQIVRRVKGPSPAIQLEKPGPSCLSWLKAWCVYRRLIFVVGNGSCVDQRCLFVFSAMILVEIANG